MRNPLTATVAWLGDRFQANRQTFATVIGGMLGAQSPAQRNLRKFKEYYATNEVVFAAIRESVSASSGIPFRLERFENGRWAVQPPTDAIMERLENPNGDQDATTFMEASDTELEVTGNSIIGEWPTRSGIGELRPLPTTNMWIRRDKVTNQIAQYIYDPVNQHNGGPNLTMLNSPSSKAVTFPANRVIHRRYSPDPWVPDWGMGPIAPTLDAIEADTHITFYIREFFKRGAVTPHIFISELPMRDEQARQMQRTWERNVAGVGNAWKLGYLDGSKGRIEKLGSAPGSREVGLSDLRKDTEVRILMALNVPPIVVGAALGLENATYSNYDQARVAMFEENTEPLVMKRDAAFTHYFRRRLGTNLIRLRGDFSNVLAVQFRMAERSERATRELQSGLTMRNEGRTLVGYPPDPDGDQFYIPLNLVQSDGSLVTDKMVNDLAGALGNSAATMTVLREQAVASACSLHITGVPDAAVQHVMVGLPPRGNEESKVAYARRALMAVHVNVRKWGESVDAMQTYSAQLEKYVYGGTP